MRSRLLLLTALLAVTCGPGTAGAQRWRQIASDGMNISDQAGLVRTANGTLHVVWRRRLPYFQELWHTTITPSGGLGPRVPILDDWASIGSPTLVTLGSQLTAAFPGTRSGATVDPLFGLDQVTSDDGGATWVLNQAPLAADQFAAASTPAAVSSANYLQAWSAPEGTVVHVGIDPAVPAVGGYGPGIDQALASSYDGHAAVAWCDGGVSLAGVDTTTGARVGDVVPIVGSGRCPADTRVALAAFPNASSFDPTTVFYAVSSASGRRVIVAGFDLQTRALDAFDPPSSGSSFKQQIALAAAPVLNRSLLTGGMWVGWRDSESDALVLRRVRHGGVWGAPVTVTPPPGRSVAQLQLNAQDDRVDVVAFMTDDDNAVSLYTTQVFPGLTLRGAATRQAIRTRGFQVLDAQDGLRGATVKVAGRTLTTGSQGYAKVDLRPGAYTVTASKNGYVGASLRVRLR